MSETEDYDKSSIPTAHKASHQDTGSDEISVASLSGELADDQKSTWAKVSGKPSTFTPEAHKASHQDWGSDEISVGSLSGELADNQKPKDHTHQAAGVGGQLNHALALTGLLIDDHMQYPLLIGRAGGQILKGGTGVADILSLQGTVGNGTAAEEAIQFLVGNAGGTIAATILNNGNVGIGTVAPGVLLDVAGIANFNNYIRIDSAGTVGVHLYDSTQAADYKYGLLAMAGGSLSLSVLSDAGASLLVGFAMDKRGIGLAKVIQPLSVELESGDTGVAISAFNPTGGAIQFRLGSSASYRFDFWRSPATGALHIQGNQLGYENICLCPTSGYVGIGTDAPIYQADVYNASAFASLAVRSTFSYGYFLIQGVNQSYQYFYNTGAAADSKRHRLYTEGGVFWLQALNDDFSLKKNMIGWGATGLCTIHQGLTIGEGTAATDYTLTFDGETNDGVIIWMEDEDHFEFADDVFIKGDLVSNTYNYGADAGTTDTYAITLDPAPAVYTTGMMVVWKANTANTGACTLNVNSLGAKSLKIRGGSADPEDNWIRAGGMCICVYDGTNFQLIGADQEP